MHVLVLNVQSFLFTAILNMFSLCIGRNRSSWSLSASICGNHHTHILINQYYIRAFLQTGKDPELAGRTLSAALMLVALASILPDVALNESLFPTTASLNILR